MENKLTQKSALIVATLTSFIVPFMGSSINLALPAIQSEFQIDAVLLTWIPTSYLLVAAVALVPFGRLADIHGRKRVFASGIMIFTFSSILAATSVSAAMLILARCIQGLGSAMIFATGIAILTSVFPPEERGKVLGINVAAVYVGLSAGPFLGGFLTQHFTWRSLFIFTIPVGLTIAALARWKLKGEWADARGEKFDFLGSIIYGVSIVTIMYGISLIPSARSFWLVSLGILAIPGFVTWERKVKAPVFEIELFTTNRVFAFSCLAALIHYSATFAITFFLSLFLQNIKGLNPQSAGVILISQPIVMAILSPFAGRLSDRIEPRIVASVGMALTSVGLFLFTLLQDSSSLRFIIGSLILLGIGFALFSSPNTNAIMSSVEKRSYGIASGSVGTMRLLGMMLSMGIATMIFSMILGRVQINPEHHSAFIQSVNVAFLIFSVLCLAGTFASMIRGKVR
jgi:EmrB/QacA subfamily drug resistance transporter